MPAAAGTTAYSVRFSKKALDHAMPAAAGTTVYSVRFSKKALDALKVIAERENMRISEAIRLAVAAYKGSSEATLEMVLPESWRMFVYRGVPLSVRTSTTLVDVDVPASPSETATAAAS